MSDAELERDLQQLSGVAAGRAWTERVHVRGECDGGERRGEEKIAHLPGKKDIGE